MLKRISIDELKEVAKSRRIKNSGKFKKSLITRILDSESSNVEHNYMKHFNNNVDNNANDDFDDTFDGKISDIRVMLSRLEM